VLYWDLNRFVFSEEIESPIQVVCIYLDALDSNTLNDNDIVLGEAANVTAVNSARCVALLRKYFDFVNKPDCSFSVVDVFVRVLADQVR
jgi:hypothetical protein